MEVREKIKGGKRQAVDKEITILRRILWKGLISPRKDREARFTASEREWPRRQAERCWREEETRAERSSPRKLNYSRIKKNAEFNKLFKRGKRFYSPALNIIVFPSAEMRMGIVVSKKHGSAVVRNRLLREVFNKNCRILKNNYSVIILPHTAEEYAYKDFEKSILICFNKVNGCGK